MLSIRVLSVLGALAFCISSSRADIAVLREKGPKSGSAFSNLGLTAISADAKVAMRDAQVKILLKKGEGDTLQAECEANFVLENVAPAGTETKDYLVAFPVTGLNSKVVTVDHFAVTVDGKTPPIVFRQAIAVSRREFEIEDKAIAGQLDARFTLQSNNYGLSLSDRSSYPASYVWSQNTVPEKTTKVKVSYLVVLHPQPISYAKSYTKSLSDDDVIPFNEINVEADNGPFYFFDYILRSGATWEGNITRETITLSIDPSLQLHPRHIDTIVRNPHPHEPEPPDGWGTSPGDKETLQALWNNRQYDDKSVTYDFKNIEPTRDLLFSIPAKKIGQYHPTK